MYVYKLFQNIAYANYLPLFYKICLDFIMDCLAKIKQKHKNLFGIFQDSPIKNSFSLEIFQSRNSFKGWIFMKKYLAKMAFAIPLLIHWHVTPTFSWEAWQTVNPESRTLCARWRKKKVRWVLKSCAPTHNGKIPDADFHSSTRGRRDTRGTFERRM